VGLGVDKYGHVWGTCGMSGVLIARNSKHLTLPIPCPLPGAKSAAQLYEKETSAKKIITFCPGLDSILGGGVSTGQLTEFCRAPTLVNYCCLPEHNFHHDHFRMESSKTPHLLLSLFTEA
jgi:hypothetical protein